MLVIGAGGHGKVVAEIAADVGYEEVAFLDDNSPEAVGKISEAEKFRDEYQEAFVGIGNNRVRGELIGKLEACGYEVPILVHPTAYVSRSAVIGKGTVAEPKAVVNANTRVGVGCIISVGAIVDHDVVLEDCVHVNAGAIVKAGGNVMKETKLEAGQVVKGY